MRGRKRETKIALGGHLLIVSCQRNPCQRNQDFTCVFSLISSLYRNGFQAAPSQGTWLPSEWNRHGLTLVLLAIGLVWLTGPLESWCSDEFGSFEDLTSGKGKAFGVVKRILVSRHATCSLWSVSVSLGVFLSSSPAANGYK